MPSYPRPAGCVPCGLAQNPEPSEPVSMAPDLLGVGIALLLLGAVGYVVMR